jgi:hypothetical protein
MDRNYKKYRKFVIDNFQKFLNGEITNHELNQNLHIIQDELGYNTQRRRFFKAVRIKFSKADSYGYIINWITGELKHGTEVRKNDMQKQLEYAIKNPKELEINYN